MSDSYSVKKITELTENTTAHDTDLFVLGNEGTATMRKVSFLNLANWVKTKISALVSSDIVNNATTNASDKVASAAVAKSLQDQITTLNSKFAVQINSITVNGITIAGNSGKQGEIATTSISGYKVLGIVGWETTAWEVAPSKLTTVVSGAKVWYSLANASTSSKTVDFTIRVLYIPTTWTATSS